MAKDKSSFILYTDLLATVSKLTDKKAGVLFKTILEYVNDLNPEITDMLIQVAFEPIKQQLKRDLKKWEGEIKDRSKAGHLGGIKSGEVRRSKMKQKEANEASALKSKQTEANEAVYVNVLVNDTVIVNEEKYINIKPDENFKLELPEQKINSAIEYLHYTKKIEADRNLILSLWTVFKEKNFTGENFYKSKAKIFTHFLETLKFENINGTHQQTFRKSGGKSAGAEQVADNLAAFIAAGIPNDKGEV